MSPAEGGPPIGGPENDGAMLLTAGMLSSPAGLLLLSPTFRKLGTVPWDADGWGPGSNLLLAAVVEEGSALGPSTSSCMPVPHSTLSGFASSGWASSSCPTDFFPFPLGLGLALGFLVFGAVVCSSAAWSSFSSNLFNSSGAGCFFSIAAVMGSGCTTGSGCFESSSTSVSSSSPYRFSAAFGFSFLLLCWGVPEDIFLLLLRVLVILSFNFSRTVIVRVFPLSLNGSWTSGVLWIFLKVVCLWLF